MCVHRDSLPEFGRGVSTMRVDAPLFTAWPSINVHFASANWLRPQDTYGCYECFISSLISLFFPFVSVGVLSFAVLRVRLITFSIFRVHLLLFRPLASTLKAQQVPSPSEWWQFFWGTCCCRLCSYCPFCCAASFLDLASWSRRPWHFALALAPIDDF